MKIYPILNQVAILGYQKLLMRTFIFLLCTSVFGFSPSNGFSQDAPITIANNQTLTVEEVFNLIQAQTDYLFVFRYDSIKDAPAIAVKKGDISAAELLSRLLSPIGYTYSFQYNTVVVSKQEADQGPAMQEKLTVNGVVRDSIGLALSGATISLQGTQRMELADINGEFTFNNLDEGAVLEFRFIGFETTEVVVTSQNADNLLVELKQDLGELEEIVLVSTGYQTISKERSAGSFSKPDMDVLHNRTTSNNVIDLLDGLVPGLTLNSTPAAKAQKNAVLIRGLSTVGLTSEPLIVVDGIPISDVGTDEYGLPNSGIGNINPQDVQDITVLKDATAASIWGSRAANGVIVINTKKGSATGKVELQYDTYTSVESRPNQNYLRTLGSQDFIRVAEDIFDPQRNPYESVTSFTTSGRGIPPHERILYDRYRGLISEGTARGRLDSLSAIDNRGQIEDLWYKPTVLTTHTLSVSGGLKGYSFYGSGNYTGTTGDRPGDEDNRYKVNIRQNFDLGKRVRVDLITDLTFQKNQSQNNISVDSRFLPYQLFRDASGNNLDLSYMTALNDSIRGVFEQASQVNLGYTPLDETGLSYNDRITKVMRNNLGIEVDIIDGLTFQGKYGYTTSSVDNENYADHKTIAQRTELVEFTRVPTPGSAPQYLLPTTGGKYRVSNTNGEAWTVRNQLSYIKDWNDGMHQLNLIAGQEAQEQSSVLKSSTVRGYDDRLQTYEQREYGPLADMSGVLVTGVVKPNYLSHPALGNISNITSIINERYFGRSEVLTRFHSYYANAAYTFNRKYSLNASIRNDQSNLFGLDKSAQNKSVWSVGTRWDLSKENFFQPQWVDNLALRITYGITGNAPSPGTAASFDILRPINSNFFPEPGLTISTPGNSKLSWERTATANIGVDFSLFRRIAGSIDVYQRKTTDLLGNIPTNPFSGYSSVTGNLGDLENKGVELGLRTSNLTLKDFSWTSYLNLAFNENTITSLHLVDETVSGDIRVQQESFVEGYPAYTLFAYDYTGLNENGDPQIRLADGSITTDPNVTTPEDVKFMGTYQPKWNGGFGNTFRYKNLSLNVNTVFNLGHVLRRDANNFYSGSRLVQSNYNFNTGNIHEEFLDRWQQPGDEVHTNVPRHVAVEAGDRNIDYYVYSDDNVVSASFIKIRDINLSYSLPTSLIEKIGLRQVTVRGQLSNLLLWTANDDGIDPEYHIAYTGFRSLQAGEKFSLGLNVKF